MFDSSTKISKLYTSTDSEHKFHKTGNRKLATHMIWTRVSVIGNRSYNHRVGTHWVGVPSSTNNGKSKKITTRIHIVLEPPWRHFTSLKLWKCSQILHPSPRVASTSIKIKTNHHWLNNLQTLHTYKLYHLAPEKTEEKLSNP